MGFWCVFTSKTHVSSLSSAFSSSENVNILPPHRQARAEKSILSLHTKARSLTSNIPKGFSCSQQSFSGLSKHEWKNQTALFLIAILVGSVSATIIASYLGGLITTIANTIVNTAPRVTLIYLVDKIWKAIANLKAKIEAARPVA